MECVGAEIPHIHGEQEEERRDVDTQMAFSFWIFIQPRAPAPGIATHVQHCARSHFTCPLEKRSS